MNQLPTVALVFFVSTATGAVADDLDYELQVKGMVCAFCAYNVSRQLRSLDGVAPDSIDVDLANGRVRLRSESKLDKAALAEVVQAAGFELESVAETASSSPTLAPNSANHRVLLSLTVDGEGLADGGYDSLLEALGEWAAQRGAGLAVAGAAGLEMRTLRPILMGRTPAIDVEFTEEVRPDDSVLIDVFADCYGNGRVMPV